MMSQSILKLEIPSNQSFGMTLSNSKTEFLNFSKKTDYPYVYKIDINSISYQKGIRIGDKVMELNGYSFYGKDIATISADFNYEKRSSKILSIKVLKM